MKRSKKTVSHYHFVHHKSHMGHVSRLTLLILIQKILISIPDKIHIPQLSYINIMDILGQNFKKFKTLVERITYSPYKIML